MDDSFGYPVKQLNTVQKLLFMAGFWAMLFLMGQLADCLDRRRIADDERLMNQAEISDREAEKARWSGEFYLSRPWKWCGASREGIRRTLVKMSGVIFVDGTVLKPWNFLAAKNGFFGMYTDGHRIWLGNRFKHQFKIFGGALVWFFCLFFWLPRPARMQRDVRDVKQSVRKANLIAQWWYFGLLTLCFKSVSNCFSDGAGDAVCTTKAVDFPSSLMVGLITLPLKSTLDSLGMACARYGRRWKASFWIMTNVWAVACWGIGCQVANYPHWLDMSGDNKVMQSAIISWAVAMVLHAPAKAAVWYAIGHALMKDSDKEYIQWAASKKLNRKDRLRIKRAQEESGSNLVDAEAGGVPKHPRNYHPLPLFGMSDDMAGSGGGEQLPTGAESEAPKTSAPADHEPKELCLILIGANKDVSADDPRLDDISECSTAAMWLLPCWGIVAGLLNACRLLREGDEVSAADIHRQSLLPAFDGSDTPQGYVAPDAAAALAPRAGDGGGGALAAKPGDVTDDGYAAI